MSSFFWLKTTSNNKYSELKQLKMDLNALKCIQMHIPQKGPKNAKKMVTNVKKGQKITYNCKIPEITKYGEQITKIDKNVNKCKKMPKTSQERQKNGKIKNKKCSSFFWLETTSKIGTSLFHMMFGSRDTHFRSFVAKIRIF